MSLANWLRSVARSSGAGRRRISPRLEVLEDRSLLSVYTVDAVDDRGQGAGMAGDLRYCITQAQGGDTITFAANGVIILASALPTLTSGISINGPGPNLMTVRHGNGGPYSVFTVGAGVTVSISGLTINGEFGSGGGIRNNGTLTINNCVITRNDAGYGGGIFSTGPLTIYNSTISGNTAGTGGGIWAGSSVPAAIYNSTISGNRATGDGSGNTIGGGIFGRVTLVNSTVSGNTANVPSGGNGGGGGISGVGFSAPFATLVNSTVTGNSAGQGGGGGIFGDVIAAQNTIIAGNTSSTGPDEYGNLSSQGHNLIGNTQGASGFAGTDLLNVNPLLGPLQDNGGPTQTVALLPGSPALNAGDPAQLGVADQRGVVRTGGVNVGAYQASAGALAFIALPTVVAGIPFGLAVTAVDGYGQQALGYRGTVHFTLSPAGASANYSFTATDAGRHTFNGLVLYRAATDTLTGTDTMTATITGQTTFTVIPAAADHIAFTLASGVTAGVPFSVTVAVQDAYGNTVTGYTGTVHFTLSGPVTAAADYTFTAADMGSRTFSNLILNQPGAYTLSGTDTTDMTLGGSQVLIVSP